MKNPSILTSFLTKTLVPVLAVGIAIGSFVPSKVHAADDGGGTVVHLSNYSNDLHAVFMALKIAGLVQEKGQKVALFVDLEGARLADKRVPNNLKWGQSESTVADLLDAFVNAGGEIRVCPHCAKAAGLEAANLRDGASLLTPEELASLLAGADKVIDY